MKLVVDAASQVVRIPADQLARFIGKFKDANSDKVLAGDGTITIDG